MNIIENTAFREIKEFIDKHKKCLQFPYSPAHFTDLMKSYSSDNEYPLAPPLMFNLKFVYLNRV